MSADCSLKAAPSRAWTEADWTIDEFDGSYPYFGGFLRRSIAVNQRGAVHSRPSKLMRSIMKQIITALALLASAAIPAMADIASTDVTKVEAGTYVIEPEHTRISFGVSHMGFTNYYGEFRNASGTLTVDPKKPDSSSVDVKVPTASVIVPNAKLKEELDSPAWLDAAKYPDISFKSTKVTKTGTDTAKVAGEFTLHGVTKPLTLDVKFNGAGTNPMDKAFTSGFEAKGKFKRSEFGVKTLVPAVSDEVDIMISAAFEKQK